MQGRLLGLRHARAGRTAGRRERRADERDRPAQLRATRRPRATAAATSAELAAAADARGPRAAAGGDGLARLERAEQPGLPHAAVLRKRRQVGDRERDPTTRRSATRSTPASTRRHAPASGRLRRARRRAATTLPSTSRPSVSPLAFLGRRRRPGSRRSTPTRTIRTTRRPSETPTTKPMRQGRAATAVTLGNIGDLTREVTKLYGPQADLDHRVRLPDESARPQSSASRGRSRRPT